MNDPPVPEGDGHTELSEDKYLRDLHRAMFGQVWTWAGQHRKRETNIGIKPAQIAHPRAEAS